MSSFKAAEVNAENARSHEGRRMMHTARITARRADKFAQRRRHHRGVERTNDVKRHSASQGTHSRSHAWINAQKALDYEKKLTAPLPTTSRHRNPFSGGRRRTRRKSRRHTRKH